MIPLSELQELYDKNRNKYIEDYLTLLRFSSVSADASHKAQSLSCATWLENYLKGLGFKVERWELGGSPSLFCSYFVGESRPTVLLYTHYDVQPVDPLNEWTHPPFEPFIQGDTVYARGAQDNKGQLYYTLLALQALILKKGTLPINVKLLIDAEEEIGSPTLSKILPSKKEQLRADFVGVVDVGLRTPKTPAVTLGVRGIVTFDVSVKGSHVDLHSGSHGGIVYNPIHALVEILSKLRDEEGMITVPHFYDDVVTLSDEEKKHLSLDFNEKEYIKEYGAHPVGGEVKYSPSERATLRPSLEINGISGGYTGKGFKTVITKEASAKISCRLVPNQSPEKIKENVASYLKSLAPIGVQIEVHLHEGGGPALRTSSHSKIVKAFAKAYENVFHAPCEFIVEGGSIPITTTLKECSGGEVALVGMGLGTDRIHAPDEHFSLNRLNQGFLVVAETLMLLGNKEFE